jgi:hypothetical protein
MRHVAHGVDKHGIRHLVWIEDGDEDLEAYAADAQDRMVVAPHPFCLNYMIWLFKVKWVPLDKPPTCLRCVAERP